jgi:beta-galactosidase
MWMWSALARGAKAINVYAWYPMSSGYESGGFGLINLDGTITERARAAGAVAKAVDANRALLLNAHPAEAEVAIVYNPMAYMVGGRQASSAWSAQSETMSMPRNSMLGYYRALFPTNVPVDFIHVDDIGKHPYKLIILPYPLMLSETAGRALREYVNNGGSLVAEARLAWNDEHGRAKDIIPGFGLHEVCGCRETAVQATPSGKVDVVLDNGDRFKGVLYEETLSGHAIAHFADGSPAIVTNEFGKGRMMAIGTFLGTAYESDRDETLGKFIRSLLDWAGVRPGPNAPAGVEIRTLESGSDRIVVVFNHTDTSVDVDVGRASARPVGLKPDPHVIDIETGGEAVRKTLEPQGVWVVRVRTK